MEAIYSVPHTANSCQVASGQSCGPCIKIEQLLKQMADAKRALFQMHLQLQGLTNEMNDIHSPILGMLPEIISRIFLFCLHPNRHLLPGDDYDKDNTEGDKYVSPLFLGSICRKWRKIAWSTPQLWTSLKICVTISDLPKQVERAREWLARSGQLPLSMHLSGSNTFVGTYPEIQPSSETSLQTLISMVNVLSNRLKLLSLCFPASFVSHLFENSRPLSILRSLYLCNVDLSGVLAFLFNKIEWGNITNLYISHLQVVDWDRIFQRATRLKHCTVHYVTSVGPNYIPHIRPTPLYELEELRVESCRHVVKYLLDRIHCPALKSLTWNYCSAFPSETILHLFRRSSCHLIELTLQGANIDDSILHPFLKGVPSLQSLQISSSTIQPDDLFLLLEKTVFIDNVPHDDIFLPQLRFLQLTQWSSYTHPWRCLPEAFGVVDPDVNLDLTQNPRRRRLQSLQIHLHTVRHGRSEMDAETLLRIIGLLRAGIDVKVVERGQDGLDLIKDAIIYRYGVMKLTRLGLSLASGNTQQSDYISTVVSM